MLQSLLGAILVHEADIVVAGSVAEQEHLGSAIEATGADVVIIGGQTPEAVPAYTEMLFGHPRLKLLLITEACQHGYLYALRPTLTPLRDLSAAALVGAIRDGDPTTWSDTQV